MLKRDIEERYTTYEKNNKINEQIETLKKVPILWEFFQRNIFALRLIATALAIITFVFQILIGNPIIHIIFCGILSVLYIFIFILIKDNPAERSISGVWNFIFLSILWTLNLFSALPKLFS